MNAVTTPETTHTDDMPHYESAILIDDNRLELMLNRSLLLRNHYADNLLAFMNPNNALMYLDQALQKGVYADSDKPVVVFLDLYMPQMSGFDFLDKFEQLDPEFKKKFKIYLLSNCNNPVELQRVKSCKSIDGFIPKPLNGRSLVA